MTLPVVKYDRQINRTEFGAVYVAGRISISNQITCEYVYHNQLRVVDQNAPQK